MAAPGRSSYLFGFPRGVAGRHNVWSHIAAVVPVESLLVSSSYRGFSRGGWRVYMAVPAVFSHQPSTGSLVSQGALLFQNLISEATSFCPIPFMGLSL